MSFVDPAAVRRAHGEDVYSSEVEKDLIARAKMVKNQRIAWFNTEPGWKLRRVVRGHNTLRGKQQYCTLCGGNKPGAIRVQTDAYCDKCNVPLCALPRKGTSGFSCHHYWHHTDFIKPRVVPRQKINRGRGGGRGGGRGSGRGGSGSGAGPSTSRREVSPPLQESPQAVPTHDATSTEIVEKWAKKSPRTLWGLLCRLKEVLPAQTRATECESPVPLRAARWRLVNGRFLASMVNGGVRRACR